MVLSIIILVDSPYMHLAQSRVWLFENNWSIFSCFWCLYYVRLRLDLGLGKWLGKLPAGLEPPEGARKGKKLEKIRREEMFSVLNEQNRGLSLEFEGR